MLMCYIHVALILVLRNFCVSQFHQDDYDIVQDRLEITEFNKAVCSNLELKVFKYNDTLKQKAINFTVFLIPGLRKNILINISLFKYVQKIYRAFPFPNMTIDLCEEYNNVGSKNPFGIQGAMKSSNFKGCPVKKGLYYMNTWILEQDKFPPHLPGGDYMIGVYARIDDDIFALNANWFGAVIKKKKRNH